jgi:hypothetical protein
MDEKKTVDKIPINLELECYIAWWVECISAREINKGNNKITEL